MTNSTKSAFCLFKLYYRPRSAENSFFSRYKSLGTTEVQKRKGVKCQLLVKVGPWLITPLQSMLLGALLSSGQSHVVEDS